MVFTKKRKIYNVNVEYQRGKKRKNIVSRPWRGRAKIEQGHTSSTDTTGQSIPGPCAQESLGDLPTQYDRRKVGRLEDWDELRKPILQAFLEEQVLMKNQCGQCQKECAEMFRCVDCVQWQSLCKDCLHLRHGHPHLHMFEIWKNVSFISYSEETPVWHNYFHRCDSMYLKPLIVIDGKGRQHNRTVEFCKCEREAVTLVRYRLWPASTKFPRVAIHFDLLCWLNALLLESHVSVKSFCEAVKVSCSKHSQGYVHSQVQNLYRILILESVSEFRHFLYKTEHASSVAENLDDGTECPACFESTTKIYSFDADFQLVRKASSGTQWTERKHSKVFLNQPEVDDFVQSYNADKKKIDSGCSEFQAGSNIRAKNKNKKLSETAVFGSACRHEYPKYFFSLKHGERLCYSIFLLQKLMEECGSDDKICIMYDIACSLKRHLLIHGRTDIIQQVEFAIPVFHAYGHKMECQVLYSPRRVNGLGLTDGECMERLWSYLGKFSKITKEMTPENRIDLLVDCLLHYGRRIRNKLVKSLPEKLERAIDMEKKSVEALNKQLESYTGVDDEVVRKWLEDEKDVCSRQSSTGSDNGPFDLTPEEQYCVALDDMNVQRLAFSSMRSGNERQKHRR
ncbi:uncharacterized protein LOC123527517 [Mercenaria mercenaria]|uniref:uncharacterized protein LOC123527517 n=1 Tax=Mercenaria mercenaria TaxID=6596 RepID=UPI00234E3E2D|nr:uncharacterized protein LOC123527517 [Mercenaria mercenaria]